MVPSLVKIVSTFKDTDTKKISLIQNKMDQTFFVQRKMKHADYFVYKALQEHPMQGIPKIYDVQIEEEWLVITEEFIQADTLAELLPFSEKEVVNIVCQLCDILMRLHQLKPPIIHRDIKPENIFYQDGKIILFDFDIARFYDPSKTRDTTLLGSVGYAAPEQFGFAQTGVQSDVYSCGKLLQVLLTGRLDQSVKGHFERIIRKALSMDPKDRFQSAAQLKAELQEMRWIFPGVNNRSRKGIIGSWIGWILSVCIVLSIDTQKNTSFEHDNLYLIACFLVLALLELVICNRHKVPKYDLSLVRWGILSLTYFLLLVGGIGILTLFDRMLSA